LVSRIIFAFRHQHQIPQEKEVYLMFDGERIDPALSVSETELSDMDYIEVYIK
jgi:hypothetical protein